MVVSKEDQRCLLSLTDMKASNKYIIIFIIIVVIIIIASHVIRNEAFEKISLSPRVSNLILFILDVSYGRTWGNASCAFSQQKKSYENKT